MNAACFPRGKCQCKPTTRACMHACMHLPFPQLPSPPLLCMHARACFHDARLSVYTHIRTYVADIKHLYLSRRNHATPCTVWTVHSCNYVDRCSVSTIWLQHHSWEERVYTPLPPGNNFWDCKCARIETKASVHHPIWVVVVVGVVVGVVVYKIVLPNGSINDVGRNDFMLLLLLLIFIDQNKETMQM